MSKNYIPGLFMQSESFRKAVNTQDQTSKLIWFVMTLSVLIYGVVLEATPPMKELFVGDVKKGLEMIFPPIALSTAALSIFLKRILLSESKLKQASQRISSVENKFESELENKLYRTLRYNAGIHLLVLALNEMVAIYGFILSLGGSGLIGYLPYALGAIALNVINFPKLSNLLEVFNTQLEHKYNSPNL